MKPNLTGNFKELAESVLYVVHLCGGIENVQEDMLVNVGINFWSTPDYLMTVDYKNPKDGGRVALLHLKEKV